MISTNLTINNSKDNLFLIYNFLNEDFAENIRSELIKIPNH